MTDEDKLRKIVSDEVRRYVQSGGKLKQLATKTDIGAGTISKLAYGETRFPRMHTVFKVLDAFGYTISAHKVQEKLRVIK